MASLFSFANTPEENMDKAILWYINSLYAIELLRNSNLDNIDLQVAWQYGQKYMTPWRDNPTLVEEFMHRHRPELRQFINSKLLQVVKRLMDGVSMLSNRKFFTMTPLEPNIVESILAGLDDIANTGDIQKRILDEYAMDVAKPNSTIRMVSGNFAGFEVLDRLLCGIFDKFPEMTKEKDHWRTRCNFGRKWNEVVDNKVYLCTKRLFEIYGEQINIPSVGVPIIYSNFAAWACLLSIVYRLSVPMEMRPGRMETLFVEHIQRHEKYVPALEEVREFNSLTVEAVADKGFPDLNCDMIKDSVLKQGYAVTAIYPNSLIERYLVSQCLLEKNW